MGTDEEMMGIEGEEKDWKKGSDSSSNKSLTSFFDVEPAAGVSILVLAPLFRMEDEDPEVETEEEEEEEGGAAGFAGDPKMSS